MKTSPVKWYVYVIKSDSKDLLYTGIATDVERRLKDHNEGKGAKFTRGRGPWRLYHCSRPYDTRGQAQSVEAQFKKLSKARKIDACLPMGQQWFDTWPWEPK